MKEMAEEKKENQDDTGILYQLHDKIREILTSYNDTVKGRCAVCLEQFCQERNDENEGFTERSDLVRVETCFHRFHLICVYRDWFMERKKEQDNFGCVIEF